MDILWRSSLFRFRHLSSDESFNLQYSFCFNAFNDCFNSQKLFTFQSKPANQNHINADRGDKTNAQVKEALDVIINEVALSDQREVVSRNGFGLCKRTETAAVRQILDDVMTQVERSSDDVCTVEEARQILNDVVQSVEMICDGTTISDCLADSEWVAKVRIRLLAIEGF